MTVLVALATLSLAVWCYLLAGNGRFWWADQRLPAPDTDPSAAPAGPLGPAGSLGSAPWPAVVAVVPARDEAAMLPHSLPTLLAQDYPGEFRVVLVDDASGDDTARVAEKLGAEPGARPLTVIRGDGPPPGWAGKVAAMNRGLHEIDLTGHAGLAGGAPEFVLFTDADIAHPADSVRRLVRFAESAAGGKLDMVSLMALLRTETAAERAIVPAFVYSFAQLYPFPRVNRTGGRTAAAAGGCMLVRRDALRAAGGLAPIAGARIDDVALGRLLKHGHPDRPGRIWLGLTAPDQTPHTKHPLPPTPNPAPTIDHETTHDTEHEAAHRPTTGIKHGAAHGVIYGAEHGAVCSVRPYPRLADLWDMIARSAYTQLRYSPLLLTGTLLGLLLMYAVPPLLGLTGLALAATGTPGAGWLATAALAAWALMSLTYLPTLRLYRLSPWRAPLLPAVMLLYAAMTADSARRHYRHSTHWRGRFM